MTLQKRMNLFLFFTNASGCHDGYIEYHGFIFPLYILHTGNEVVYRLCIMQQLVLHPQALQKLKLDPQTADPRQCVTGDMCVSTLNPPMTIP